MDWLNPVCHRPIYDEANWDLDRCFQATTLTLLPTVVLAVTGAFSFPALWRRYKHGERERLPKEGKSSYAVKLVRPLACPCPCASLRHSPWGTEEVEAGIHSRLPEGTELTRRRRLLAGSPGESDLPAGGRYRLDRRQRALCRSRWKVPLARWPTSVCSRHSVRLREFRLANAIWPSCVLTRAGKADGRPRARKQLFAHCIETASHPLLPHASTPLLFWSLLTLAINSITLRSYLIAPTHPHALRGPALGEFILLVFRLTLVAVFFGLELLGPQGWEGMTWRDFVPFVESQGKVRLGETEEQERNGGQEDEYGWEQKECPRLRANIFQRLTFSWMTVMYVLFCFRLRRAQF